MYEALDHITAAVEAGVVDKNRWSEQLFANSEGLAAHELHVCRPSRPNARETGKPGIARLRAWRARHYALSLTTPAEGTPSTSPTASFLRMSEANRRATASTALPVESSHSHTTKTRQPSTSRDAFVRRSLATFASNLRVQASTLLFGVLVRRHPSWRCQKHPCTKTTARNRGRTMSGVPAKSRRCSRNRSPSACNPLRSRSSGLVSRPRTRDISADLACDDRKSVTRTSHRFASALERSGSLDE